LTRRFPCFVLPCDRSKRTYWHPSPSPRMYLAPELAERGSVALSSEATRIERASSQSQLFEFSFSSPFLFFFFVYGSGKHVPRGHSYSDKTITEGRESEAKNGGGTLSNSRGICEGCCNTKLNFRGHVFSQEKGTECKLGGGRFPDDRRRQSLLAILFHRATTGVRSELMMTSWKVCSGLGFGLVALAWAAAVARRGRFRLVGR
jgi:hypothetical protein